MSSNEGDDVESLNVEEKPKTRSKNPNWEAARLKANETRRQLGAIARAKKLQAKLERDEAYKKALEVLSPKTEPIEKSQEIVEEPVVVAKKKPRTKIIELSDSSSEEEESESDDGYDVVRVVRKPKAKPKAVSKRTKTKKKKIPQSSSESDSESDEDADTKKLSGQVARDVLRRRVLEKAQNDAIRMLVPNFRGFSYM